MLIFFYARMYILQAKNYCILERQFLPPTSCVRRSRRPTTKHRLNHRLFVRLGDQFHEYFSTEPALKSDDIRGRCEVPLWYQNRKLGVIFLRV